MSECTLTCRQTGQAYQYEVFQGLKPTLVLQLESEWSDEKRKVLRQLLQDVPEVQNDSNLFYEQIFLYGLADLQWSWLNKAAALTGDEYHWFFLRADSKIQAVCIIYHPKVSREDGERIFYIDYVASAYWNRSRPGYTKQFSSVGRILISHALHFATTTLGYRPGFCLHSLPTAESYYKRLGMVEYEKDVTKENLRYYEAPQVIAEQLEREVVHE